MPLEAGSLVAGYRIDELISRDGMEVVYRVTSLELGGAYALKVLAPELADDETFRRRFMRETQIATSFHHPNVVAVHNADEHDGLLFLVMDYIPGEDLRTLIRASGSIAPDRATNILAQVAAGLDAAH